MAYQVQNSVARAPDKPEEPPLGRDLLVSKEGHRLSRAWLTAFGPLAPRGRGAVGLGRAIFRHLAWPAAEVPADAAIATRAQSCSPSWLET